MIRRSLALVAVLAMLLVAIPSAAGAYDGSGPVPDEGFDGGDSGFCAVDTDGGIDCWGSDQYGQLSVPAGKFAAISSGYFGSCGLRPLGDISCWGTYSDGATQPVAPAGPWSQVAFTGSSGCALSPSGVPQCFADGTPPTPSTGIDYTKLVGGGRTYCGLHATGALDCFGTFWSGADSTPPVGTFIDASVGSYWGCAIQLDHNLNCWGELVGGQPAPTGSFRQVTMHTGIGLGGQYHSCAVHTNMTAECWGRNDNGQLDAPPGLFMTTATTGFVSCGQRPSGRIECWGLALDGVPTGPHAPCTIRGTNHDDILIGTSGEDVICGGDGNDILKGVGGNDWLLGEAGADTILAGNGDDVLTGGQQADALNGGTGRDVCVPGDAEQSCERHGS